MEQITNTPTSTKRIVIISIALLIAGLLGVVGLWYVLRTESNDATTTAVSDDISIDTKQLPEGWTVTARDTQNIAFSDKVTGCFVAVNKLPDAVVKVSDAPEYLQIMRERLKSAAEAKGYRVTELPLSTFSLQTNQGTQSVKAIELELSGPQGLRQSYGYMVRDGYVYQIQRSCPSNDVFGGTTNVLRVVTVRI